MTTKLPRPTEPFTGQVERLITDAKARRLEAPTPPDNAPNVLLVMLDDVGFGSFSTFGGPVEAAGFQSVADNGLRVTSSTPPPYVLRLGQRYQQKAAPQRPHGRHYRNR